ncbi:hypothetical protein FM996_06045 [Methylosinus sporium]|uniref:Small metal-binding protein n=2 Tax=Methylocystaceae TaxID=31993 RepID=A0A2U1SRR3_METSR|nr:hypothetical protein [Methylosinus sp. KRF6]PWB94314.1 hypothetical protein C5689_08300 [Methylosinus sporium]TRL36152.1 hypothetical protein FM996_06045 [Methylosinus sporium]
MCRLPDHEETTMKLRTAALTLAFGGALFASTLARADDRLDRASHHVEEAITQVKLKDTGLVAYHADLALEKAESLQKFQPDAHLAAAIDHLKAAIEEARQNHLAPAGDHVKAADAELKQVAK